MKSLEDRLSENQKARAEEEAEKQRRLNANAALAAELATHIEKFASNKMIPVETSIENATVVTSKAGKKLRITAHANEKGNRFNLKGYGVEAEDSDEDHALDQIMAFLFNN